uniref:Uncharacterized protein n=1 Tax=Trypanosoma vivax (strain Y486) TaxID=1055687 RepID=G0U2V2_TRYVY|nr:hypothetical protein, unlikely [Trypanosoma vivax Y486]
MTTYIRYTLNATISSYRRYKISHAPFFTFSFIVFSLLCLSCSTKRGNMQDKTVHEHGNTPGQERMGKVLVLSLHLCCRGISACPLSFPPNPIAASSTTVIRIIIIIIVNYFIIPHSPPSPVYFSTDVIGYHRGVTRLKQ